MNVIEVHNLKKQYGPVQALDGVSFEVTEGEVYGLLGPNGAGKTTTLEILEGLKSADLGEVKAPSKGEFGVVLQQNNFLPGLSLRELFELFASFYEQTEELGSLTERFALTELLGRDYHSLSGGQRQRFVLALALINKPKLLFLDEPTLGLDPQVRQNIWQIIQSLKRQGITMLLTTHYMEEAEILCDRVGIIDHGRVLMSDKPVKLINSLGVISKIRFMSSRPIRVDQLEQLPGIISVRRDRYSYDLETEIPEKSLRKLLEWEKQFSGKIFNLQVRQATLEDVFLKLTGHSLRE